MMFVYILQDLRQTDDLRRFQGTASLGSGRRHILARWAISPMFATWAVMFSIRTARSVRPFNVDKASIYRLELPEGLIAVTGS